MTSNVADEAQVAAMVERTVATFGKLDMAFNNVDQEKSIWKPKTPDELQKATLPGKKPAMMLVMIDQNDQVTEGFQYDDETLAEVVELLKNTADTLSGLHLGLRMDLAGGL